MNKVVFSIQTWLTSPVLPSLVWFGSVDYFCQHVLNIFLNWVILLLLILYSDTCIMDWFSEWAHAHLGDSLLLWCIIKVEFSLSALLMNKSSMLTIKTHWGYSLALAYVSEFIEIYVQMILISGVGVGIWHVFGFGTNKLWKERNNLIFSHDIKLGPELFLLSCDQVRFIAFLNQNPSSNND